MIFWGVLESIIVLSPDSFGVGASAIFDQSGKHVITGSNDWLVKIWSMETAYCLASYRGHEWRLADGLPILILHGHTKAVTAIAAYHLLSSSDDGTCRIWDARHSHISPRIYVAAPPESTPGTVTNNGQSSSASQETLQIFCCAFNASGTVFVTSSPDTRARLKPKSPMTVKQENFNFK